MARIPETTALLIIDVQDGFDDPYWGARNNPDAEDNIARLLAAWRAAGRLVFHVRHDSRTPRSPLHPSSPGNAIKAIAAPRAGEPVIAKDVNSAFIGTGLEPLLRAAGVTDLVIVGLTTPHCVSTSTRMAANLGFGVRVVADATAAFEARGPDGKPVDAHAMHYFALAGLNEEFAAIVTTDDVLA